MAGDTHAKDTLDDLFDYDPDLGNIFDTNDHNKESSVSQPATGKRSHDTSGGLGIDEEIKITKKRKPIAKLDEARYERSRGSEYF